MSGEGRASRLDGLPLLMLAYGAASLVHHVHNAVFLDAYPNMPAWLSPARVYTAWVGVATVGLAGYLLLHRRSSRLAGLVVVGVYAALGLDGLGHYSLAPLSAHTFAMNLTIWLEVLTATVLVIAVAGRIARRLLGRPA